MNARRTVETASSVWTFDVVAGTYTRVPADPATGQHPNVPYFTGDMPYSVVRSIEGGRLAVVHPDGSVLVTGRVLKDSDVKVEVRA